MNVQARLRPMILVASLGLLPMLGCMGASDDRLGSNNASPKDEGISNGTPINTKVQQERQDKGDTATHGTGTNPRKLPGTEDTAKTGGLGGLRDPKNPPGPGALAPPTNTDSSGPK